MTTSKKYYRMSLFVILLTVFIDALGVGLVYPIASPLLLDMGDGAFLPQEVTVSYRGWLLGTLMASFTIGQFLASPIVGGFSDLKGRKKVVIVTLCVSMASYLLGGWSLGVKSVVGLFSSRFLAGIAAGNAAVMQASMADLSSEEEKAKRFGWTGASFGIGFVLGPLLAGKLSDPELGFTFATPFWISAALAGINLLCAIFFFLETAPNAEAPSVSLWTGLIHLKRAFQMRNLRALFSVMFLYFFGWELFFVFTPVFLIAQFQFSTAQIAQFYTYSGLWFVISNGVIMRLTSKYSPAHVLKIAFPLWGLSLGSLCFVKNPDFFWIFMTPLPAIGAIIFSTGSALVSNLSPPKVQGETLGIYQSVQAAALALPPLCVGSMATIYPAFPLLCGATCLLIASLIWWTRREERLEDES